MTNMTNLGFLKPTITKKVWLLLFIFLFGAVANLIFFYHFLSKTRYTSHIINVMGSQRMVSEELRSYAIMVSNGHEEDRKELIDKISLFDSILRLIEKGGRIREGIIPPIPDDLSGELTRIKDIWLPLRESLLILSKTPYQSNTAKSAIDYVSANIPLLTSSADSLVSAAELSDQNHRQKAYYAIAAAVVLDLLLLIIGLFLTKFFIAKPVEYLYNMKPISLTITKKVGFLLSLFLLVAVANLIFFYHFLSRTRYNSRIINAMGSQRMASEELRYWAIMVSIGQSEDRKGLIDRVSSFDSRMNMIEKGGRIRGGIIPPAPGELTAETTRIRDVWLPLRESLLVLSKAPYQSDAAKSAMGYVSANIPLLTSAADSLVSAMESVDQSHRETTYYTIIAAVILDLLLLIICLFFTKLFIAKPVEYLYEASVHLSREDFSYRVPIITNDELSVVSRTFNEMVEKMADLIINKDSAIARIEASEKKYKDLVEDVDAVICEAEITDEIDLDNLTKPWFKFVFISERVIGLLGVSAEELLADPMKWLNCVEESHRHLVIARCAEAAKTGGIHNFSFPIKKPDGKTCWVQNRVRVHHESDGKPKYLHGLWMDITEEHNMQERIRDNENELNTIFESSPVATLLVNVEGIIERASGEVKNIFGWEPHEITGRSVDVLVPEKHRQAYRDAMTRYWTNPTTRQIGQGKDLIGLRRDGKIIPLDIGVAPVKIGGRQMAACYLYDVSERQKLEQQLRQSQKMEAIGEFSAGIAHDFNNILGSLSGFTDAIMAECEIPSSHKKPFEGMIDAIGFGRGLTRQLLAFSRKEISEPVVFDLNDALDSMGGMLKRLVKENILISIIPTEEIWYVKADKSQIEQVIINFVANAKDAMPNGGKLLIETSNMDIDEDYVRLYPDLKPGRYVMLSVSDTGLGIPDGIRDRIFEPFYTTKDRGKGTGLGLSTVYGIVKQSGGSISVYSESNKGTRFIVYLPAVKAVEKHSPGENKKEIVKGNETILLVEDDPQMREAAEMVLMTLSYNVHPAAGVLDAVSYFRDHLQEIDLVMTDMVMPDGSGIQLYEQIKKMKENLKIIFTSGYTDDVVLHQGIEKRSFNFIQKPFTRLELSLKIRSALDKK